MNNKAPCKGCPDRTTGDRDTDCHATCERYAAFLAERNAENEKRRMYQQVCSAVAAGHRRLKERPPSRVYNRK